MYASTNAAHFRKEPRPMKRAIYFFALSLCLPVGGRAFADPGDHHEHEMRREEHEREKEHRQEQREERKEERHEEHREDRREMRHEERHEMGPRFAPPRAPEERWERRPGYVWSPGYHEWRKGQCVWTGGHYEAERPGYRWPPPSGGPRGPATSGPLASMSGATASEPNLDGTRRRCEARAAR